MAATAQMGRPLAPRDDKRPSARDAGNDGDFLAPVIAGAFARGIAEAFDLIGTAAFFLDREGHILFASKAAQATLGRGLEVRSDHLLASDGADNQTLASFLSASISDPQAGTTVALDGAGLTLRALPPPGGLSASTQLLHAIVMIDAA